MARSADLEQLLHGSQFPNFMVLLHFQGKLLPGSDVLVEHGEEAVEELLGWSIVNPENCWGEVVDVLVHEGDVLLNRDLAVVLVRLDGEEVEVGDLQCLRNSPDLKKDSRLGATRERQVVGEVH